MNEKSALLLCCCCCCYVVILILECFDFLACFIHRINCFLIHLFIFLDNPKWQILQQVSLYIYLLAQSIRRLHNGCRTRELLRQQLGGFFEDDTEGIQTLDRGDPLLLAAISHGEIDGGTGGGGGGRLLSSSGSWS